MNDFSHIKKLSLNEEVSLKETDFYLYSDQNYQINLIEKFGENNFIQRVATDKLEIDYLRLEV